jgi:hypothetical protein
MKYHLTSAQRCVLADCVRAGLVGWLITCPVAGQQCRLLQAKATGVLGFSFSRFASMASTHFGHDYSPSCSGNGSLFPLSITEAGALANDVEMDIAAPLQVWAAGMIAAHSPYAQPEVLGRDWRTYTGMLAAVGIDWQVGSPDWKEQVRRRTRAFRKFVAISADHAIAAE